VRLPERGEASDGVPMIAPRCIAVGLHEMGAMPLGGSTGSLRLLIESTGVGLPWSVFSCVDGLRDYLV